MEEEVKQYIYQQRVRWSEFRKKINTMIDNELARLDELEVNLIKGSNQAERVETVIEEIEKELPEPVEKKGDYLPPMEKVNRGQGERDG